MPASYENCLSASLDREVANELLTSSWSRSYKKINTRGPHCASPGEHPPPCSLISPRCLLSSFVPKIASQCRLAAPANPASQHRRLPPRRMSTSSGEARCSLHPTSVRRRSDRGVAASEPASRRGALAPRPSESSAGPRRCVGAVHRPPSSSARSPSAIPRHGRRAPRAGERLLLRLRAPVELLRR